MVRPSFHNSSPIYLLSDHLPVPLRPFSHSTQLTHSVTHVLCSYGTEVFISLSQLRVLDRFVLFGKPPPFSHLNNPYSSFKVRALSHFYITFPNSSRSVTLFLSTCFHETLFLSLLLYSVILCLYVMVSTTECLK